MVEAALVNKLIAALLPCEVASFKATALEGERDSGAGDMPDAMEMPRSPQFESDAHIREGDSNAVQEMDKLDFAEVQKICELYQGIQEKSMSIADIAESNELLKLEECLMKYKAILAERSPTAKLWLQYIEYIQTLNLFIRAERTGKWSLHLMAVTKMLNLFAATGHINYAKSALLYLQLMLELPNEYPWLYQCFIDLGFHTVCRNIRYWAGLWTYLGDL